MNKVCVALCCVLVSSSAFLSAETPGGSSSSLVPAASSAGAAAAAKPADSTPPAPFSRIGLGAGLSFNGINLQAATNVSKNFNVRAIGNVFKYNVNDLDSKGFNGSAKLNLATFGVSLDYYPWAKHGFRLSPGLLFYNENRLTGSGTVAGGQTFKLNGATYYSSSTNPVGGTIGLGLNARKPSFTMTTGWGNIISRTGGHWSFPLEIGAAFVGDPKLTASLTGVACTTPTTGCSAAATDPTIQANLNAQVAKSQKDLNVLSVYPIISFGVGYNFHIR